MSARFRTEVAREVGEQFRTYLGRLETVKGVVGIREVRAEDLLSCVGGGGLKGGCI